MGTAAAKAEMREEIQNDARPYGRDKQVVHDLPPAQGGTGHLSGCILNAAAGTPGRFDFVKYPPPDGRKSRGTFIPALREITVYVLPSTVERCTVE